MGKIDTEWTNEIICPYCSKSNGDIIDGSFVSQRLYIDHEHGGFAECTFCGCEFNYYVHSVDLRYTTKKIEKKE
jgi:uncharacterized Zn-finger protein